MKRIITICCIMFLLLSITAVSQSINIPTSVTTATPRFNGLPTTVERGNSITADRLARIIPGNDRIRTVAVNGWRMASYEYFSWNDTTSTWTQYQKNTYSYNASGRKSVELTQMWNGSGYDNNGRSTYTYDAQGDNTYIAGEYWYNDQWNDGTRRIMTYDGSHRILTLISGYWAGIGWMDESKTIYTYDGNGHETEMLQQTWTGAWQNSLRTTSTYDGNGFRIQQIFQSWDTDHWVNQDRWTITNNAQGKSTLMLMETWNASAWTTSQKITYTYDAGGNLTKAYIQMWYSSQWNDDYQELYTYDGNGNKIEMIGQLSDGSTWTNSMKFVYTWEQATGVNEQSLTADRYLLLNNFPNPFNPSTNIQFTLPSANIVTLKIYDVLGREISTLVNERKSAGSYSVKWDAAQIPSGVYFCRLTAGNFSSMKKMVVMK
jgi:hypothetical protein